MTGIARLPIVERIQADGRGAEALSWALDRRVAASKTTAIRCPNAAAHAHGDVHASLIVKPDMARADCASCGGAWGVLDLAVLQGVAPDRAAAADALEARLYGPADASTPRNGTHIAVPQAFPFVDADVVRARGWKLDHDRDGTPLLRAPVLDGSLAPCGTKVRGPRVLNGKIVAFLEPTADGRREPGLIGAEQLEDTGRNALVLVVAGETDLLALDAAAAHEGTGVRSVSPSNGEGQKLAPVASAFRGLRVAIIYDQDEAGRKGAAARVEELRETAQAVAAVALPFAPAEIESGAKDLRDWLALGGTAARLLDLAERALQGETPEAPRTAFSAADLLAARDAGELRSRPFIVDGLIRRGDGLILFGPAGLGKSQLALALSVALAAGRARAPFVLDDPAFPQFAVSGVDPLRVLYVAGEDEPADFAERLAAHLESRHVLGSELALDFEFPSIDARNLMDLKSQENFFDRVRKFNAAVVVLDNLSTVTPGLDKSDEVPVRLWLDAVPERLKRDGRTVVLLGHSGKGTASGDAREALDRLFGSYAWGAWASGAVMLDWKPGDSTRRRLIHAKARGTPQFAPLIVGRPDGDAVFTIIGLEDLADPGPLRPGPAPAATLMQFRDALAPIGTKRSVGDVAETLGVSRRTVYRRLQEWSAALGEELEDTRDAGPHGERWLRLRPLQERVARMPREGVL